jgi:hypothetical protein
VDGVKSILKAKLQHELEERRKCSAVRLRWVRAITRVLVLNFIAKVKVRIAMFEAAKNPLGASPNVRLKLARGLKKARQTIDNSQILFEDAADPYSAACGLVPLGGPKGSALLLPLSSPLRMPNRWGGGNSSQSLSLCSTNSSSATDKEVVDTVDKEEADGLLSWELSLPDLSQSKQKANREKKRTLLAASTRARRSFEPSSLSNNITSAIPTGTAPDLLEQADRAVPSLLNSFKATSLRDEGVGLTGARYGMLKALKNKREKS